ncbi:MAG: hypothetical protein PHN78_06765 [Dehalococcoidales bacterium]|nr:hypothetical protein [Dehalococcoidales bacterium]
MPSLKLFISTSAEKEMRKEIVSAVKQRFLSMPDHRHAVLAFQEGEVLHGENATPYWLEVRASRDTSVGKIEKIANHFLDIVDVEAYHPATGAFVFVEKGQRLTDLEEVTLRAKSSYQKDDCMGDGTKPCPNKSTLEVVCGKAAIRCCTDEACVREAVRNARLCGSETT